MTVADPQTGPPPAAPPDSGDPAGSLVAARHVFVINDEPAILALFQEILEEEGYRVTLDTFGRVGVREQYERIAADRPDLVVLDFLIGGEPMGWQLVQLLKMRRATETVPIVVCTAAVSVLKEIHAHLSEMGVGVVVKPFDIDHLLDAVRRALAGDAQPMAVELPG